MIFISETKVEKRTAENVNEQQSNRQSGEMTTETISRFITVPSAAYGVTNNV